MVDRYLLESGGTDGYLDESGTGVLLLEASVAWTKNLADTMSLNDGFGRTSVYNRALADTMTLADGFSRVATYVRTLANSISLLDAFNRTATYDRTLTDTITLDDTFTRQATYLRTLNDTLTLVDDFTRTVEYLRTLSDTLTLTDEDIEELIGPGVALLLQLADTLKLSASMFTQHHHFGSSGSSVGVGGTRGRGGGRRGGVR